MLQRDGGWERGEGVTPIGARSQAVYSCYRGALKPPACFHVCSGLSVQLPPKIIKRKWGIIAQQLTLSATAKTDIDRHPSSPLPAFETQLKQLLLEATLHRPAPHLHTPPQSSQPTLPSLDGICISHTSPQLVSSCYHMLFLCLSLVDWDQCISLLGLS